jgi:hypothetical protein
MTIMAEEKTTPAAAQNSDAKAADAKPKAAAKKKEKPPKLEDKPFNEFMEQHFVPELNKALEKEGWTGVQLAFEKAPLAVKGASQDDEYWQVQGIRQTSGDRQFNVVFAKEDISGPKYFYYSQGDSPSSTVEQFMGDERRITLDLMVLYTLQRLNGQKWLTRN